MSHWRRRSRSVIEKALKDGRASGLEGKALVKFVDQQYPWGERAMWPYRIWLDERRLLLRGLVKPPKPKERVEWPHPLFNEEVSGG